MLELGKQAVYLVWVWRSILPWWAQDWGTPREREGEGERRGGGVQSDRGAGLLVLEVTVMQSWRSENLQVQAGHRTRQLLHIIWMHRASEIVNNTHTVTLWWLAVKTTSIRKCTCVVFIITELIFVFMSVLLMCSWCRSAKDAWVRPWGELTQPLFIFVYVTC